MPTCTRLAARWYGSGTGAFAYIVLQRGGEISLVDQGQSSGIALSSPRGRLIVGTTVLGSAVAMLTATVVNIALPSMAVDLGASTAAQQWIINAYLLTLASFILIGGSLGDRFGRVRIYRIGLAVFAVSSVLCAVAPTVETLIACRLVQGLGAALLTPGSLAILEAVIRPRDRAEAIGLWSALGGLSAAIGPLVGGVLVDLSWRWVFLINLPIAAAVFALASWVPETRDPRAGETPLDTWGALLTVVGLGGVSYALIEGPRSGFSVPEQLVLGAGLVSLVALIFVERRVKAPLIPVDLFAKRAFLGANLVTVLVYAGLGAVFLLLSVQLQVTAGWSALGSGAAMLPVTAMILAFSSWSGRIAGKYGPRWPLTIGPLVMVIGMLLMVRIDAEATFIADVLPSTLVFGFGLAVSVAPVTSAALAAVPDEKAGAASGTNSALARTGQLVAVAAVPPLAGLGGDAMSTPALMALGFPYALWISTALVGAGGLVAFFLLESKAQRQTEHENQALMPIDGPLQRTNPRNRIILRK